MQKLGWIEYTVPLSHPLPLHMTDSHGEVSLQRLLDIWTTGEESKRLGLMHPLPSFFLIQLVRFVVQAGAVQKNSCQVTGLEEPLHIASISETGIVGQAS